MTERTIAYNNEVLSKFALLDKNKRMGNTYLFVGPRGIGKFETAKTVAKMLNCENTSEGKGTFCGNCPACIKIDSMVHPDLAIINNGLNETVKIAQIRSVMQELKLKPVLSRFKICIITNVENLTLESSNALLKTLEEPLINTLIILTAAKMEKILATVLSRCHVVKFPLLSREDVYRKVVSGDKISAKEAQFIADASEGCFGRALSLKQEGFFDKKNYFIDHFILSYDYQAELKEILKDSDDTKGLLYCLESWISDAVLIKAGIKGERIINQDRARDLNAFCGRFDFYGLNEIYVEVANAIKSFDGKLNIKIPLLVIKAKIDR